MASEHFPWIPFKAKDWLDDAISSGKIKTVFEYGCGESTLYFQDMVEMVVSVEHDESWFSKIASQVGPYKARMNYAPAVVSENGAAIPRQYQSLAFPGKSFEEYVEKINADDFLYDLVFIDGRARSGCIASAIRHVRAGGYLMLDNADRARYEEAIADNLSIFERIDFRGPGPIESGEWLASVWCIQ